MACWCKRTTFTLTHRWLGLHAVNAVISNTSGGGKMDVGYKLLLLHNAVVRIDYYVYGFNLYTNTGFSEKKRNGLVFVSTISTVDMKSIGLETLVYLTGVQAAQVSMQAHSQAGSGAQTSQTCNMDDAAGPRDTHLGCRVS